MGQTPQVTEKNDLGAGDEARPGPSGLSAPTGQRVRTIGVVVLVLALAAATLWWLVGRDEEPPAAQPQGDRAAAVAVARQVATNFFSLDHETVEDDIAAVESLATGTLAETYSARSADLARDVRRRQLVVTAELPEDGTAVEALSADAASILVSVDASSVAGKGEGAGKEQVTLYRVRVTLVPVDGDWRASGLEQVEAGAATGDGEFAAGSIAEEPEDSAVVQTAADGLEAALSYDFRDLDAGLARATKTMTDDFATEFSDTFTSSAGRLAEEKRAVADAVIRGAGLVTRADGSATVLVYVDQMLVSSDTTENAEAPLTVNQSRVLVDLTETDGVWLIAGIQPF